MNNDQEIQIIQSMYDRIYDIVTYSPSSEKASIFDPKDTLVQIVPLGMPVNPKDFVNLATPINPNGSLTASEMFANLVDDIPSIGASYHPSGRSIDKIYGEIVNDANTTEKVDPEAENTYTKAYNYLNQTTSIKDYTGATTTQTTDTPIYAAYKQNRLAYLSTLSAYRTAYNNYDLTDPAQQRQWQANSLPLQGALDNAWNTWRSQGAAQVEQALAALDHTINNAVSSILEQDKQLYENSKLTSQVTGGGPWHLSYPTPTNWVDPNSDNLYFTLTLSTQKLNTSAQSQFTSYGGGANFNYGLWSVGGSFNHEDGSSQSHTEATNIDISMDICVVEIMRPWMDSSIFKMGGWNMGQAYTKGEISSGNISTSSEAGVMPLIPTAFIAVKNVKIKGDWGTQDESHIQSATSGKTSVGWGPFQISGSYSHSSSDDKFSSNYQNGTISIPGIQIIAFINQVTPFCPPQ